MKSALVRVKPRVVVVGSGWGGYSLAKQLNAALLDVHVVSPRNFMLFTPLLASTAVGTLEFRSIAQPVAGIPHTHYHMARVVGIDFAGRRLHVSSVGTPGETPLGERSATLRYDYVVLAPGAQVNTFNIPGVREHAVFLKELWDARAIRQRTIANVQAASFPGVAQAERRRLLSFVIVGGGPTGVEYAAELHDFLVQDLSRLYPDVAADLSITLIEGKSILGSFDAQLRDYAEKKFKRDKIDIRYGANVVRVEADAVHLSDGGRASYGVLVWNTGLAPQALVQGLDHVARDAWGHLIVNECLQVVGKADSTLVESAPPPMSIEVESMQAADVPRAEVPSADPSLSQRRVLPGVYALGDAASVLGEGYAATAQVAEQQGTYLAGCLNDAKQMHASGISGTSSSALARIPPARPFSYVHRGSLAMLGGFLAVTDWTQGGPLAMLRGKTVKGFSSWLLWRSVYFTKLGSWRNRLQVPADWARTFFFGRDITAF